MEAPKQDKVGEDSFKKRYFSRIPGAHYTFPDGHQIHFLYGYFDFDSSKFPGKFMSTLKEHPLNGQPKWKIYFDELEYLVTSGNPLVFDQNTVAQDFKLPKELDPSLNARSEAEIARQDGAILNSGKRVNETGDVNKGSYGGGDVNASTVDHELAAVVLGKGNIVGPGASKADQIKAAAAARTQQATTAVVQNSNGVS